MRHDGLALARPFRRRAIGWRWWTGAPLAACRMYRGFGAAWSGFLKDAREGMATLPGLPVRTVLPAGAHPWPWALLPAPGHPAGWKGRAYPATKAA